MRVKVWSQPPKDFWDDRFSHKVKGYALAVDHNVCLILAFDTFSLNLYKIEPLFFVGCDKGADSELDYWQQIRELEDIMNSKVSSYFWLRIFCGFLSICFVAIILPYATAMNY